MYAYSNSIEIQQKEVDKYFNLSFVLVYWGSYKKERAIGQCSKDSRWKNESSLAHLETAVMPMERK